MSDWYDPEEEGESGWYDPGDATPSLEESVSSLTDGLAVAPPAPTQYNEALSPGEYDNVQVESVYDGDTFTGVIQPERAEDELWRGKVRFAKINALEMDGPQVEQAMAAQKLAEEALGESTSFEVTGTGKYGRTLATGGNVGEAEESLVKAGLAARWVDYPASTKEGVDMAKVTQHVRIDGEKENASWWDKMMYNWDSTEGVVGHWATMLEAALPNSVLSGRFRPNPDTDSWEFASTAEMYGSDFAALSYEERKARIQQVEQNAVDEHYKQRFGVDLNQWKDDPDSFADEVGRMMGELVDPTSVLAGAAATNLVKGAVAAGAGLKASTAASTFLTEGAWGAQWSATKQYATQNQIDPVRLLLDTVMAGGLGAAMGTAGAAAAQAWKLKAARRHNIKVAKSVSDMSKKEAEKLRRKIDNRIVEAWDERTRRQIEQGTTPDTPLQAELLDTMEVSRLIEKEFPNVAADLDGFAKLTGADVPRLSRDAARDISVWKRSGDVQGFQGWLRNNSVTKNLDYLFGNPETTVKNIDPSIHGDIRKADIRFFTREATFHNAIGEMESAVKHLSKTEREAIWESMYKQDWDMIASYPDKRVQAASKEIRGLLDEIGTVLQKNSVIDKKIEGYFPHIVKDIKGLRDKLGQEHLEGLDKFLHDKVEDMGRELSEHEEKMLVTRWLETQNQLGGKRSFAKERTMPWEGSTQDFREFYYNPQDSLLTYARESLSELAIREFFDVQKNKGLVKANGVLDIGKAVSEYVAAKGHKKNANALALKEILTLRFDPSRRQTSKGIQYAKELTHGTLLSQFSSAVTQIGDLGVTAYKVGARDAFSSVIRRGAGKLLGRKAVIDSQVDLGVTKAIYELSTRTEATQLVDRAMRYGGFNFVDRVNKNILADAALGKALRLTDKGAPDLFHKYAGSMGDDWTAKLYRDLHAMRQAPVKDRHLRMTQTIKEYALMELADAQPINQSQMPRWIQEHPNASFFTSLLSYTFKTWDIARQDIVQQLARGNIRKAAENMTRFSIMIGGSNAAVQSTKDWMQGKDVYKDEWYQRWGEEMLNLFGFDKYGMKELDRNADVVNQWITRLMAAPSMSVLAAIIALPVKEQGELMMADKNMFGQKPEKDVEQRDSAVNKGLQKFPVFGKALFGHNPFTDPDTEYNERTKKERARESAPTLGNWGS